MRRCNIGGQNRNIQRAGELEKLRDRIEELETLVGLREPVPVTMGETESPYRVHCLLEMLLRRELVTKDAIRVAFESTECLSDIPKHYMALTRKWLRRHDIEVRNSFDQGWFLTPPDKDKLRKVLDGRSARI